MCDVCVTGVYQRGSIHQLCVPGVSYSSPVRHTLDGRWSPVGVQLSRSVCQHLPSAGFRQLKHTQPPVTGLYQLVTGLYLLKLVRDYCLQPEKNGELDCLVE